MNIWGKVAITGVASMGLSVLLFVGGVMLESAMPLLMLSITLSALGPFLLLVALIGHLVTRATANKT